MSTLQPFMYGTQEVRTITIDNEPWFVLNDLCAILELGSPHKVASRLDDDDRTLIPVTDSRGRQQSTTIVSEGGMFDVIVRSDSPHARPLQRWVTHEVLPQIRKTGSYNMAPLSEDEIVSQALQITAQRVKALEAKVQKDAPKVFYVDTFVADNDTHLLRTVASNLNVGENELRLTLWYTDWIYRESQRRRTSKGDLVTEYQWSEYSHKKPYFHRKANHEAPLFKGNVAFTLKVTPAGASAIERHITPIIAKYGSLADGIPHLERAWNDRRNKKKGIPA